MDANQSPPSCRHNSAALQYLTSNSCYYRIYSAPPPQRWAQLSQVGRIFTVSPYFCQNRGAGIFQVRRRWRESRLAFLTSPSSERVMKKIISKRLRVVQTLSGPDPLMWNTVKGVVVKEEEFMCPNRFSIAILETRTNHQDTWRRLSWTSGLTFGSGSSVTKPQGVNSRGQRCLWIWVMRR